MTQEGREKFRALMLQETWDGVRLASATAAADALNGILQDMLDRCFPWNEFSVKSTDPPWMNNDIRRCSKRKRRKFREQGRGPEYRGLEMEILVKKAKMDFFENVKEEMFDKGNTRGYHKAVKRFTTKEAPSPWDVRTMMPGKSD